MRGRLLPLAYCLLRWDMSLVLSLQPRVLEVLRPFLISVHWVLSWPCSLQLKMCWYLSHKSYSSGWHLWRYNLFSLFRMSSATFHLQLTLSAVSSVCACSAVITLSSSLSLHLYLSFLFPSVWYSWYCLQQRSESSLIILFFLASPINPHSHSQLTSLDCAPSSWKRSCHIP